MGTSRFKHKISESHILFKRIKVIVTGGKLVHHESLEYVGHWTDVVEPHPTVGDLILRENVSNIKEVPL